MFRVYKFYKSVSKPTQTKLSHLVYKNFKLNMIHVISPDNTRRNIAEFEQEFDDDVVFF